MTVQFDHCHKNLERRRIKGVEYNWYEFRIFVKDLDALQNIDYVEYHLHPSFANPIRKVGQARKESNFYLKVDGVSAFSINIIVRFNDGTEEEQLYSLNLNKPCPE
jgi:transcription initiation factor IIF auxiliary subunit